MKQQIARFALLVTALAGLSVAGLAQTSITTKSASPSTITFSGNDPDIPTVTGSSPAAINFTTSGGRRSRRWLVQVAAATTNFGNCPSLVPANRVTLTCGSVTVDHGGNGACMGPITLSNNFQNLASGFEGSGGFASYTINATFGFQDSWNYVATPGGAPCSITLNYQITAF